MSLASQSSSTNTKTAAAFVPPKRDTPLDRAIKLFGHDIPVLTDIIARPSAPASKHGFPVDALGLPILTDIIKPLPSGRINSLNDKQTDQFLAAFSSSLRQTAKNPAIIGLNKKLVEAQKLGVTNKAAEQAQETYRAAFELVMRNNMRRALQPATPDRATHIKFVAETKEALAIYQASQARSQQTKDSTAKTDAVTPTKTAVQPVAKPSIRQSFVAAGKALVSNKLTRLRQAAADKIVDLAVNLAAKIAPSRPVATTTASAQPTLRS
jgi:hypothetical protein